MDTIPITRPYTLIETRSKRAVGTWPRQGPNRYAAVVEITPGDLITPYRPSRSCLRDRAGVRIVPCGSYYSAHTTERSAYYSSVVDTTDGTKNNLDRRIAESLPYVDTLTYCAAVSEILETTPSLQSR